MSRLLAGLGALSLAVGVAAPTGPPRHVVLTFTDPRITEASGLVARGGLFTTVNDSGDSGRVFTVDASGRTVGVTSWPETAIDDEALAPLPHGRVLVGDIGDNLHQRAEVTIRVVPVGRGERTVRPASYRLRYPDGPADAETLLVAPSGRVVIVTKGIFGGRVLQTPQPLGRLDPGRVTTMRLLGTALGVATDGAFFPDGRHLIVRDYGRAVVYAWPGLRPVGSFTLPRQPQGEGIAVAPDGTVYVDSEGLRSQVLRVALPGALRRVVEPAESSSAPSSAPASGASAAPDAGTAGQAVQPAPGVAERPVWPWALGGLVLLAALVLLLRSLRPR